MWSRFGQTIVAEREGAQYYWVGADMQELAATQSGNALDLTYHLTEAAYLTVRSRYTGGGTAELARRRFRTAGPRTERLLLESDRPLAWIEIVVEPTYSSYTYREKVFQVRFDALERH